MKKIFCAALAATLLLGGLFGCGTRSASTDETTDAATFLNLANNAEQSWTYDAGADCWTLSIVCAVTNPEIPDEQGVSVCVPGAYVKGVDTDGDKTADVAAADASGAVNGSLVIDYDATVVSTNGQVYTAATAPVIVNTGAAGYSAQSNQTASSAYAADGYVNVACGNRGKQDTVTDDSGNTVYTGDAPCCLVDQKNAVRFVKYNILLGNLPGSVEYFVSTGGSGGGAHATMLAATSDNPAFYPYEAAAGAVGVTQNADGSYSTAVSIDGTDVALSDGVWGCVAYSAITSLAEADLTMAFEYYLDADYDFNTAFQKQLAQYLSAEYMEYLNAQNLTAAESLVGFDLNGDGDTDDTVALTIEYDETAYAETNGYGGSYLTLYLDTFVQNLQWYVDNLDYAEGWTWFDADGAAMTDAAVAAMTTADKTAAFLEGRYAKSTSTGGMGGMGGAPSGTMPDGQTPPSGTRPDGAADNAGMSDVVGTPDKGTTQSASGGTDSANYASYEELVAAYEADVAAVEAGDAYGNNIVALYDPLNYVGADGTQNPTWTRIMMGAAEGDMSLFASLNLQIAWQNAGTDAKIEWQWDGVHVPSEILGESLVLYVDEMFGKYVEGAVQVEKPAAVQQTTNGTATAATGTNISSWASCEDGVVSFSLADAAAYRTAGASKATPGFDVLDYGQEDYVFGSATADARHWDKYVLRVLQTYAAALSPLFNQG